eukprot:Nk52_evm5s1360 gene=Nk52_evmTU5s1360
MDTVHTLDTKGLGDNLVLEILGQFRGLLILQQEYFLGKGAGRGGLSASMGRGSTLDQLPENATLQSSRGANDDKKLTASEVIQSLRGQQSIIVNISSTHMRKVMLFLIETADGLCKTQKHHKKTRSNPSKKQQTLTPENTNRRKTSSVTNQRSKRELFAKSRFLNRSAQSLDYNDIAGDSFEDAWHDFNSPEFFVLELLREIMFKNQGTLEENVKDNFLRLQKFLFQRLGMAYSSSIHTLIADCVKLLCQIPAFMQSNVEHITAMHSSISKDSSNKEGDNELIHLLRGTYDLPFNVRNRANAMVMFGYLKSLQIMFRDVEKTSLLEEIAFSLRNLFLNLINAKVIGKHREWLNFMKGEGAGQFMEIYEMIYKIGFKKLKKKDKVCVNLLYLLFTMLNLGKGEHFSLSAKNLIDLLCAKINGHREKVIKSLYFPAILNFIEQIPESFIGMNQEEFGKLLMQILSSVFPKKEGHGSFDSNEVVENILIAIANRAPEVLVSFVELACVDKHFSVGERVLVVRSIGRLNGDQKRILGKSSQTISNFFEVELENEGGELRPFIATCLPEIFVDVEDSDAKKHIKVVCRLCMSEDDSISSLCFSALQRYLFIYGRSFVCLILHCLLDAMNGARLSPERLVYVIDRMFSILDIVSKCDLSEFAKEVDSFTWKGLRIRLESLCLVTGIHSDKWARRRAQEIAMLLCQANFKILEETDGADRDSPFLIDYCVDKEGEKNMGGLNDVSWTENIYELAKQHWSVFYSQMTFAWRFLLHSWNAYFDEQRTSMSDEEAKLWRHHVAFMCAAARPPGFHETARDTITMAELRNFFNLLLSNDVYTEDFERLLFMELCKIHTSCYQFLVTSCKEAVIGSRRMAEGRRKQISLPEYSLFALLIERIPKEEYLCSAAIVKVYHELCKQWLSFAQQDLNSYSNRAKRDICTVLEKWILNTLQDRLVDVPDIFSFIKKTSVSIYQPTYGHSSNGTDFKFLYSVPFAGSTRVTAPVSTKEEESENRSLHIALLNLLGQLLKSGPLNNEYLEREIQTYILMETCRGSFVHTVAMEVYTTLLQNNHSLGKSVLHHTFIDFNLRFKSSSGSYKWLIKAANLYAVVNSVQRDGIKKWEGVFSKSSYVYACIVHLGSEDPLLRSLAVDLVNCLYHDPENPVNPGDKLQAFYHDISSLQKALNYSFALAENYPEMTEGVIAETCYYHTILPSGVKGLTLQTLLPWIKNVPRILYGKSKSNRISSFVKIIENLYDITYHSVVDFALEPFVVSIWKAVASESEAFLVPELIDVLVEKFVLADDKIPVDIYGMGVCRMIVRFLSKALMPDDLIGAICKHLRYVEPLGMVPLAPGKFLTWYEKLQSQYFRTGYSFIGNSYTSGELAAFFFISDIADEFGTSMIEHLPILLQHAFVLFGPEVFHLYCNHYLSTKPLFIANLCFALGVSPQDLLQSHSSKEGNRDSYDAEQQLLFYLIDPRKVFRETPNEMSLAIGNVQLEKRENMVRNKSDLNLNALLNVLKKYAKTLRCDWSELAFRWALWNIDSDIFIGSLRIYSTLTETYSVTHLSHLICLLFCALRDGELEKVNEIQEVLLEISRYSFKPDQRKGSYTLLCKLFCCMITSKNPSTVDTAGELLLNIVSVANEHNDTEVLGPILVESVEAILDCGKVCAHCEVIDTHTVLITYLIKSLCVQSTKETVYSLILALSKVFRARKVSDNKFCVALIILYSLDVMVGNSGAGETAENICALGYEEELQIVLDALDSNGDKAEFLDFTIEAVPDNVVGDSFSNALVHAFLDIFPGRESVSFAISLVLSILKWNSEVWLIPLFKLSERLLVSSKHLFCLSVEQYSHFVEFIMSSYLSLRNDSEELKRAIDPLLNFLLQEPPKNISTDTFNVTQYISAGGNRDSVVYPNRVPNEIDSEARNAERGASENADNEKIDPCVFSMYFKLFKLKGSCMQHVVHDSVEPIQDNAYLYKPEVTGISPNSGGRNTVITIRGVNLGKSANDIVGLTVCGVDALYSLKFKNSAYIKCIAPNASGSGPVIVTTKSGGVGICGVEYTYTDEPSPWRSPRMSFRRKREKKLVLFGGPLANAIVDEYGDVPIVVKDCIELIEARGLDEEGIYRIPGKVADVNHIKQKYNRNAFGVNLEKYTDIHTICGCLKQYFRELPEPVITFNVYSRLMDDLKLLGSQGSSQKITSGDLSSQSSKFLSGEFQSNGVMSGLSDNLDTDCDASVNDTEIERIAATLNLLPRENFNTLKYLLRHLKLVVQHKEKNKMSLKNLCVVFGASLLKPKEEGILSFQLAPKHANAVAVLLRHFSQIFELSSESRETSLSQKALDRPFSSSDLAKEDPKGLSKRYGSSSSLLGVGGSPSNSNPASKSPSTINVIISSDP